MTELELNAFDLAYANKDMRDSAWFMAQIPKLTQALREAQGKREALEKENAALRAALEFYAFEPNYGWHDECAEDSDHCRYLGHYTSGLVENDCGATAREALGITEKPTEA